MLMQVLLEYGTGFPVVKHIQFGQSNMLPLDEFHDFLEFSYTNPTNPTTTTRTLPATNIINVVAAPHMQNARQHRAK